VRSVIILHAILTKGFYGSERYCIELAAAQSESGHEVHVLIQGRITKCAREFDRAIIATRARMSASSASGAIELIVIPKWIPAVAHRPLARLIIKRIGPDIVHSHLAPAARRIGAVARRLGVPHVATVHLDLDSRKYGMVDGLVALTANQCRHIPVQFRGAVETVWNWLSPAVEESLKRVGAAEIAEMRRTWQADDATVVFGTVGRLQPQKGLDILIAAFRAAFPTGTEPTRLVIVGEGPQRHDLEALAVGDPRIRLVGAQENVAAYYRAFDVFVSASRFEPFGLAIVEAMAAGCSLILTRTEGPSEFATGSRVLWAEPGDHTTLAERLRIALRRRDPRQKYDMTPFSLARAAYQIEQLYRRTGEICGRSFGYSDKSVVRRIS
jgi:glycosyltransferase involved in cell wall biosynthesis